MTKRILHVVTHVGQLVPSCAVVDGNLVTGQNPGSAKETAEKVAALL